MTSRHEAPPRVFAEPDYCYGIGPLTIRVQRIDWANPVWYEGEQWYHVDGVEIGHNGTELGQRMVLVRGSRLRQPPSVAR